MNYLSPVRRNKELHSEIDNSVNFIENQLVGFLESRYVRREDKYFICYLSSQTGCNRGCKFCHLTATNQMSFKDSDYQDYLNQTLQVFRHYRASKIKAQYVHFNYMARGEALANKHLLNGADDIIDNLTRLALKDDLRVKHNISTIMPVTLKKSLVDIFKLHHPTMYYSLYSTDPAFRDRWLPAAHSVDDALRLLKEYQDMSKKIVKIHFAFIENENDSQDVIESMCNEILKRKLAVEFNIVRYNPYSPNEGSESPYEVITERCADIHRMLHVWPKIITRVGLDVKASCGQFVS